MDDPSLLSDVNRWVGVAIAGIGTVIVSPDGARLLWGSATEWMRQREAQVRGRLARFLPFLRRPQTIHPESGGSTASVSVATVTASGRAWHPTAPVDERIEALRRHITEVEGRLNDVIGQLREETASRERVVAELERTMKAETAELRLLLDEQERQTALTSILGQKVVLEVVGGPRVPGSLVSEAARGRGGAVVCSRRVVLVGLRCPASGCGGSAGGGIRERLRAVGPLSCGLASASAVPPSRTCL